MPSKKIIEFAESHNPLKPNVTRLHDVAADERIELSVYLKSKMDLHESALPVDAAARRDAVLTQRTAQYRDEIVLLREFAQEHGLEVTAVEPARRLVKMAGTAAQMESAFRVRLGLYSDTKRQFRSYQGMIALPEDVLSSVESVLGLDNEPIAEPRLQRELDGAPGKVTGHWPNQIAALYNFPVNTNGAGQCIAIIALGGGYYDFDIASAFEQMGLPVPTVVPVSVDGEENNPEGEGADEVTLDIQVAGGAAPGARLAVYFAPNSSQGFIDAVTQATQDRTNIPSVMSISGGSPEAKWDAQSRASMDSALNEAGALGLSVFAAAGDHLGTDNYQNGRANVRYPAASPYAIGCGGTVIDTSGGSIKNEWVWNEGTNGRGTGGGISDYAAVPWYQKEVTLPPSVNDGKFRRGVPDVAAVATGYRFVFNGKNYVSGGTGAVAALWSALAALTNETAPQVIGFFLPQIYTNPQPFREIVQGNNKPVNSKLGYNAGGGWNACTGLGVPDGAAFEVLMARPSRSPARLASVQWSIRPVIHLFYQGIDTALLDYFWNGSHWTPGEKLPKALLGSSIAAASWQQGDLVDIRVYYQDARNLIQEYCWFGDHWAKGSTLPVASRGSGLAAIGWLSDQGPQIRVYYLDPDNIIREYGFTRNHWLSGATLPAGVPGTGLAAVALPPNQGMIPIRVYYVGTNNIIQEYCWDGGRWSAGAKLPATIHGSGLAAAAFADGKGQTQIRVFYFGKNNYVQEYGWHGDRWKPGATLGPAVQDSGLAAVGWYNGAQEEVRVYYQDVHNAIREERYSAGAWSLGQAYIPVVFVAAEVKSDAAAEPAA